MNNPDVQHTLDLLDRALTQIQRDHGLTLPMPARTDLVADGFAKIEAILDAALASSIDCRVGHCPQCHFTWGPTTPPVVMSD